MIDQTAQEALQRIAKSNPVSIIDLGDRFDRLMVLWLRRETNFGMLQKHQPSDVLIEQRPCSFHLSIPIQRANTQLVSMGYLRTWGPRACKAVQLDVRIVGADKRWLGLHWSTARSSRSALPSHITGLSDQIIVLRLVKPLRR